MPAPDLATECTVALVGSAREGKTALTSAERAIYASLPRFRQGDWLCGRLAAKRAIAKRLGIDGLDRIEVRHRQGRAPITVFVESGAERVLPVAVSITHREGRGAAVASAEMTPLGIDLEVEGSVSSRQSRYFLTPSELRVADATGLTQLWALKEAAWKALACDDRTPFKDVELCLDQAGMVTGVARNGNLLPAVTRVMHPWAGFVLAIVQLVATASRGTLRNPSQFAVRSCTSVQRMVDGRAANAVV